MALFRMISAAAESVYAKMTNWNSQSFPEPWKLSKNWTCLVVVVGVVAAVAVVAVPLVTSWLLSLPTPPCLFAD